MLLPLCTHSPLLRPRLPPCLPIQILLLGNPADPRHQAPVHHRVECLRWGDIEKEVQSAQGTQTPDCCPPGQLFGPGPLHSRILQWGHSLLLNCHPMVSRTLNLLTQHFWSPSLQEDTREFGSVCPASDGSKVSRSTLVRHLRSLPVPRCPWSHILIDFVKFYFLSLFGPTYLRLPVLILMCFTCASFSFFKKLSLDTVLL